MLFPTHILLTYALERRTEMSTRVAVLGAVIPDIVDKPLALLGVFDHYHNVCHSALFLLFILPIYLTTNRPDTIRSLVIGWGLHILLDAVHLTVNGRPENVVFILWPVVTPETALGLGPVEFATHYIRTPSFYLELLIIIWVVMSISGFRGREQTG